eukprot:TRINITY_DN4506_c0_g1_i2.p1 TRINITY_DN4506_c0_g1~~TRINITY_DN4506_c0_g1_i2.p1  ORF type:complete len:567 (-),score=122.42 TRINITY_DN4506_c0_g1_i2:26-1726(-)
MEGLAPPPAEGADSTSQGSAGDATADAGAQPSPPGSGAAASNSPRKMTASPSKQRLDLEFRMCDVYRQPRLPHARSWNSILKSAEDMKFGQFPGMPCPGRSRNPDAGKREETPPPEKPKRPRVPLAPRRQGPKPDSEEGKSAAELDCAEKTARSLPSVSEKPALSITLPKTPRSDTTEHTKPHKAELALCKWCGEMQPLEHPKQCKQRQVECKHCKRKMKYAALRHHLKNCEERPGAQEARRRSAADGNFSTDADFESAKPHEQLRGLRKMSKELQHRLLATLERAKLGEAGIKTSDSMVDLSLNELENDFQAMVQKLALVEARVKGSSESRPSPNQELLRPEDHTGTAVAAMSDLERRLRIFDMAVESQGFSEPKKPRPVNVHQSPPAPGSKRSPVIADASASMSALHTPRSIRLGNQLPPLETPRAKAPLDSGRARKATALEPRMGRQGSPGSSASESHAHLHTPEGARASSTDSERPRSRESIDEEEIPPLLKGPGPAAVGYRDTTLHHMRKEIEDERQRYIAQRIKALQNSETNSKHRKRGGSFSVKASTAAELKSKLQAQS